MATARRLFFWNISRPPLADLITLLFSSLQNSESGGDGDSGDSCADNLSILTIFVAVAIAFRGL
jgi:hypothetical protein